MAKLTAPCLSLSASGRIAKTLVFATWKGIKYARQYVIPANPNSGDQQTQRGYLTAALTLWHDTAKALNALDKSNLNRGAQYEATPMSGFNAYVKRYVNTKVAGATPIQIYNTAENDIGAGTVQIEATSGSSTVNVGMRWGFSPTAMLNVVVRTEAAVPGFVHTFDVATTTEGQVMYYQVYDLTADSTVNMGIGRIVVTA